MSDLQKQAMAGQALVEEELSRSTEIFTDGDDLAPRFLFEIPYRGIFTVACPLSGEDEIDLARLHLIARLIAYHQAPWFVFSVELPDVPGLATVYLSDEVRLGGLRLADRNSPGVSTTIPQEADILTDMILSLWCIDHNIRHIGELRDVRTEIETFSPAGIVRPVRCVRSIKAKRQIVIENIDEWISRLQSNPPRKRIRIPEEIVGSVRVLRLAYGNKWVALHWRGAYCTLRSIDNDPLEDWRELRRVVQAGKYDFGIEKAAAVLSSRHRLNIDPP